MLNCANLDLPALAYKAISVPESVLKPESPQAYREPSGENRIVGRGTGRNSERGLLSQGNAARFFDGFCRLLRESWRGFSKPFRCGDKKMSKDLTRSETKRLAHLSDRVNVNNRPNGFGLPARDRLIPGERQTRQDERSQFRVGRIGRVWQP